MNKKFIKLNNSFEYFNFLLFNMQLMNIEFINRKRIKAHLK